MSQGTRTRNDGERYRKILNNFGGSGAIQGTEDWPIDPDVEDAKAIGVAVLFGIAAVAVMPSSFEVIGFALAGLFVATAGLVVYVCPPDRSPLQWLGAMARFKRRPKRLTQHAESDRENTRSVTRIERILSFSDAVQRRDGTLVGAVKVEGRDMSLAETGEWLTAADGFEGLADALDGGFEVYSPARVVESNALVKDYYWRETDDDVKQNDTLATLIDTYKNELPRQYRQQGVAVRDFYVIVWVTPREVRRADHGVLAKLAELQGVGPVIERIGLARRGPGDKEIETRQKSILSARKRAVVNAVSSIDGCDADDVDAEHLAAILKEFWTGIRTPRAGKPPHKQRVPVVIDGDRATDRDATDADETGGY